MRNKISENSPFQRKPNHDVVLVGGDEQNIQKSEGSGGVKSSDETAPPLMFDGGMQLGRGEP